MCNSFAFYPCRYKEYKKYREEYYETICQILALCTRKSKT